ncbi:ABC transporter A family member 2 [Colletotrichum spaethianum]|uniref:ABC transporter A family member 2 n=1 Tax=Colletotrichum spaethianum TaxID=700344 RepID=A0AA37UQ98_9PEZI|nr:ABC transporter A family member 2 [Colletotrichum spaethianum]GKT48377.1 ABC transporter A family member 2 [Colletotrichum spaethianum]
MGRLSGLTLFCGQIRALAWKTFLIAVARHPLAFVFKAYLIPVAVVAILLNIPNFTTSGNVYGTGTPNPLPSLAETITEKPLFIVKPLGLGPDVDEAIAKITQPLRPETVRYLNDERDLLTECLANLRGISGCHASITFTDSPQTTSFDTADREHHWNYTIRADPARRGVLYNVFEHNGDLERFLLPLQVAVENAMTNSTTNPVSFLFTSKTQKEWDEGFRSSWQELIANVYGFAFFLGFIQQLFHLTRLITQEREDGMSKLVDAMGGSATVRVLSYLAVFNVIYLPLWIILGAMHWKFLWPTSSAAIPILWQILLGLAINSSTVFAASFFQMARTAPVYVSGAFMILSVGALLTGLGKVSMATVLSMSLFFPSSNHFFFVQTMSYWEFNLQPAILGDIPPPAFWAQKKLLVAGNTLLLLLVVAIVVYPLLAILVERFMHGIAYKGRTFAGERGSASSIAVGAKDLQKIFEPSLTERIFCCGMRKPCNVVNSVNLQGNRGQILCLVGPNGSGKTSTLQMMAGLLPLTNGTVDINALPSELGICPQRNTVWSELTVKEHLSIWNLVKGSRNSAESLKQLIAGCDLAHKASSLARTLSGGQLRKLQLACMFVGYTSVCLVDECTSGLVNIILSRIILHVKKANNMVIQDPLSRRVIWDILLEQRSRRSIIFTTHFLDEVEVLADHIVILSNGRVKCSGSVTALKQLHGGGYKVSVPHWNASIDQAYPHVTHQDQLVYTTPDSTSAAQLATNLAAAGMSNVSILGPQVEDVFLRVVDDPSLLANTDSTSSDMNLELEPGKMESFWSQVKTLFWKRTIVLKRFWWPYIYVLVLPIAVTLSFSGILNNYTAPLCVEIQPTLYSGYEFYVSYGGSYVIDGVVQTPPGLLLGGPPSVNESLYNLMNRNGSITKYFNMSQYTEWIRPVETLDEFMNYLNENRAGVLPGGIFMESNTSNPVIASFAEHGVNDGMILFNLYSQIHSGSEITASYGTMGETPARSANSGMFYAVFFCLIQAVYPAAFALYPSIEKSRKVRAVGYANGVRRAPLWVAYALFDFFFVSVISITIAAHLGSKVPLWTGGAWVMLPVLALYGLAALLFSYIMSILCKTGSGAFLATSSLNVPYAFVDVADVDGVMTATTFGLNIFFPIGNVFRSVAFGLNAMEISCRDDAVVSASSIHAYGGPVLYLIVQVAALLGILIWLERDHSSRKVSAVKYSASAGDSEKSLGFPSNEVKVEKVRVEDATEDPLRTLHLTKTFGQTLAVNDVSLGIGKGEVLALIGPNGAGKSTLINLLRGELTPDHGNGYLCGKDAKSVSAQKHLGVCAQYDALDLMSTREHLVFFAKIKGVKDVQRNVETIMVKLGLAPYATRLASKLSGGNKRKLSLAIALMGTPPVLILDEPTSAMDAIAKRAFWKIIQQISPNRSLLLTTMKTHSMEEADTLAHRAAVMSQRLLAVGTTQSLRQRYGNVYYVEILLKTAPMSTVGEMTFVRSWVQERVLGAVMEREVLGGQIRFTVPGSITRDRENIQEDQEFKESGVGPIVDLIRLLEAAKEDCGIEYYSIGGTTLERVFLNVVKENIVEQNEEEKPKKRWWKF